MCGAASKTSAAAIAASWLPKGPPNCTLGRAKANAKSAIAPARNSNSNKCRSLKRRWLASCRFCTNLSAGNSSNVGLRRMIKCSIIGTAISALPASSETLTKVITKGFRVQGSGFRTFVVTDIRKKIESFIGLFQFHLASGDQISLIVVPMSFPSDSTFGHIQDNDYENYYKSCRRYSFSV